MEEVNRFPDSFQIGCYKRHCWKGNEYASTFFSRCCGDYKIITESAFIREVGTPICGIPDPTGSLLPCQAARENELSNAGEPPFGIKGTVHCPTNDPKGC